MRIMFSGYRNPNFPTITEFCESALANLGHEVVYCNDRRHVFPGRLRKAIPLLSRIDLALMNRSLLRKCRTVRPEVFIALGGTRILPGTVQKIHAMEIRTVLWTVDPPVDFSAERKTAPFYDHVFCGGSEAEEILHREGLTKARWLPFAMDTTAYYPLEISNDDRSNYQHDILSIGSYYPNRWELLQHLADFNVGIYGPGWARAGISSIRGISTHDAQLHFSDQLKLYASAAIVVIIHYQDGKTPCYQASPKVYEALACRQFVLVDRQKDVFALFKDGEHLVGFDSKDDLKQKVQYYLDHPEERRKIAAAGYRESVARHTYRYRIEEMLRNLGA